MGLALLAAIPTLLMYYVYSAIAAVSFGAFSAIDQALMVEILPSKVNAARDMGILNTTNTLTGVIAGGLGAAIIGTAGYTALFCSAIVCGLVSVGLFIPIKRVR